VITITQGRYEYGDFALAMDFTIEAGSCVAVLGPSGAGKSTFLNILAGFETLSSGTLTINNHNMAGEAPGQFPVSMIFQDNNTFAHLSVFANVALGIARNLRLTEKQQSDVTTALARIGLANLAQRKPGEMSGGERQRIALARVLVRNRPVLLLDEPFAALGPSLRKEMLDLVASLHHERKLTTLMVTHAPEDAKRIANHVIFINNGKARAPVPTPKFFLYAGDPEITSYLGTER
jgi:thiamine transport system ATP-binding protein